MKICFLEEVDSTNNVAKKMAQDGEAHATLVVAKRQTAGRGRLGRRWDSSNEGGIWMSLIVRPDISPEKASMLTLVAALAVRKTILDEAGVDCLIKWPNDLVSNGRKVCGILTEMNSQSNQVNFVIIGIGINVNSEDFDREIKDVATSLKLQAGKELDKHKIINRFGEVFEEYYKVFLDTQDMSGLMKEYNECLANFNNRVKVLDADEAYTGVSGGINKSGELLVTDEDNNECVVRSGEVSVRGIYGYV